MNLLSAVIAAVPDTLIICVQVGLIIIVSSKQIIKSRFFLSLFVTALFDIAAELYFDFLSASLNFVIIILNGFKSCFLIWFSIGKCVVSDVLMAIVVQEFCIVICSVIYSALPSEMFNMHYSRWAIQIIILLIILISILVQFRKKDKHIVAFENISDVIPKRVFVFAFLSLFTESGVIEMLGSNKSYSPLEMRLIKILLFALTVINAIIITTLVNSVIYGKYNDNLNQMLKRQVDSQLSHYEKREQLNTETRSFRHDFNNHIKCLESMMVMERYTEVRAYLRNLSGMMPSGEFLFRTGNYIADAILTEIQEANENVKVEFKGMIPQSIDNSDVCIILSNAMDNAAEACGKLSGRNTISVYGNCQQGIFVLVINNPTVQDGYAMDEIPKTSKHDRSSHGFGLSNIQRIVKKYNGTIHTLIENGVFTLSLTLSVDQTVHIS